MRLALALWICLTPISAFAADATRHFATASGLHFFAGEEVQISETGADSIFAAGGTVDIGKAQAEHIFAAGRLVRVTNAGIEDAFLAGRRIEIGGNISDDIFAAGETIYVGAAANVGGDGLYAGGTILVSGTSNGDVIAAGRRIELAGSIAGNVTLASPDIVLRPGLKIGGALSYRSPTPLTIPEGVSIGGAVRQEEWPDPPENDTTAGDALGGAIFLFAALALFAGAVVATTPSLTDSAVERIKTTPWRSVGAGLATVVGLPFIALLVCLTVIGIPLGLFLVAAGAVAFGGAAVIGWTWLGSQMLKPRSKAAAPDFRTRMFCALAGLSAFVLIGLIPAFGVIAQMILVTLGYGALVLAVRAAKSSDHSSRA